MEDMEDMFANLDDFAFSEENTNVSSEFFIFLTKDVTGPRIGGGLAMKLGQSLGITTKELLLQLVCTDLVVYAGAFNDEQLKEYTNDILILHIYGMYIWTHPMSPGMSFGDVDFSTIQLDAITVYQCTV
jgi:hypothetical protein